MVGLITASNLKTARKTNTAKPAKSLVKFICYPEAHKFSTAATRWGCKHEGSLNIDPRWPYLGASADGIVDCRCCGIGVSGIKCPYTHKDSTIAEATGRNNFSLKKDEFGKVHLDKSRAYYHQAQSQMFICGVEYCDFVV